MERRAIMRLLLIQLVFVLSWSSGFIGAKLGTDDSGAINLLFWRFLLVCLCLLPFIHGQLAKLNWERVRYNAVIGFLSQFAYLVSLYIAIRHGLPAGIAAIIAALQPLITAAMTNISQQEQSGRREWLGLLVGFAGVGVVISGEYALSSTHLSLWVYALPLVSAITLSIATLYQRRQALLESSHSQDGMFFPLFLQSATSLILLTAIGSFGGVLHVPSTPSIWVSIIWLTVFSTFLAYLSLWRLLKDMSATKVAALVYLEPPVTLIWAAWMFGDAIHLTTYAGIAVVAAGILIARRSAASKQACATA